MKTATHIPIYRLNCTGRRFMIGDAAGCGPTTASGLKARQAALAAPSTQPGVTSSMQSRPAVGRLGCCGVSPHRLPSGLPSPGDGGSSGWWLITSCRGCWHQA
jgi:hypothetical protein